MSARKLSHLLAAAGLALSVGAGAQTFAITGGTVYTMGAQGKLENATVLIRDAKIVAVGNHVRIPSDAVRIDAHGKIVTPGIVDPNSHFGIEEISLVHQTVDASVKKGRFSAAFDVANAINPRSMLIPINRIEGVTTAMVAPSVSRDGSIIAGRGAIIDLGSTRGFIHDDPAALFVTFGEDGAELAGGSRAAAMEAFREALQDAKDYAHNRQAFDGGRRRPYALTRLDLEALIPVVLGRMPVVVSVNRASDISATLRLAHDFGLHLVIEGGAEAWMVANQLAAAHVPVLLNPMQDLPDSFDTLGSTLENAARLQKTGVLIAFETNDSHNARNIKQAAGNAVAYGLPYDAALAAMTINPAKIYGIESQVGRLVPGTDADVVVWSGDPLEVTTFADAVFIRGKQIPMVSRATELRDRYMKYYKDKGAVPPQYFKQ